MPQQARVSRGNFSGAGEKRHMRQRQFFGKAASSRRIREAGTDQREREPIGGRKLSLLSGTHFSQFTAHVGQRGEERGEGDRRHFLLVDRAQPAQGRARGLPVPLEERQLLAVEQGNGAEQIEEDGAILFHDPPLLVVPRLVPLRIERPAASEPLVAAMIESKLFLSILPAQLNNLAAELSRKIDQSQLQSLEVTPLFLDLLYRLGHLLKQRWQRRPRSEERRVGKECIRGCRAYDA